ncbi:MAG TPA: Rieske (2Fe-2S) protein [bacterium]|nr:Rieske (2Fe-2S) protein [bacterium]
MKHISISDEIKISRKQFFIALGSGAIAVATVGGLVLTGEFINPNVLFEPPTKFLIGKPNQYALDSVLYLTKPKVLIFRENEGYFYAISSICTHLGCIVRWIPEENKLRCPCHGSQFNKQGDVIGGPAPKPLQHIAITLTSEGYLEIDRSVIVDPSVILKI